MAIRTFQRGSATYKCNCCGRATRNTGDEGNSKLCSQCYDLAGIENSLSDGHTSMREEAENIERLTADVAAKGGSLTEWQGLLTDLGRARAAGFPGRRSA